MLEVDSNDGGKDRGLNLPFDRASNMTKRYTDMSSKT